MLGLPQQLADVSAKLQTPPPPAGEVPLLSQAVQVQLQARKLALERQQAAIQREIDVYDAEDPLDIPRLRRELLDFRINRVWDYGDTEIQRCAQVLLKDGPKPPELNVCGRP